MKRQQEKSLVINTHSGAFAVNHDTHLVPSGISAPLVVQGYLTGVLECEVSSRPPAHLSY